MGESLGEAMVVHVQLDGVDADTAEGGNDVQGEGVEECTGYGQLP